MPSVLNNNDSLLESAIEKERRDMRPEREREGGAGERT